jgi:transcriptional regulator with XRE-family HTH domain
MPPDDPWAAQRKLLGNFIRSQRRLANLSLRDLAERTAVSNPYLSQIERGLHEPSVRVLRSIASALNISAETLLTQAGLLDGTVAVDTEGAEAGKHEGSGSTTEAAIRLDPALSQSQKEALLAVYRGFVATAEPLE